MDQMESQQAIYGMSTEGRVETEEWLELCRKLGLNGVELQFLLDILSLEDIISMEGEQ